ncbi:putative G3BP-like protein isoform X1 [Setaria italica]|uniref:putative G3BP-like protein isoform X1 n=1 Tax=Setaria italica TaxID=4555 RepID=UPI0003511C72|nr:putative G3BP-like protein isoform X1 [Setaria italica]
MDPMEQPEPEIAGHYYALQVGSYFLTGYYNVLANQPHLAIQFYTDNSSVVRLDCETGQWSFGETVEVINDMMMSMNVTKVEVKTANFLESWGGAITLLVTGLVQLKDYPVRKRFVQNIVLAPKKDGYYIFSDIFKLICDEYDNQYHVPDYNCADNMPQVDASYTMAETGSDYLDGEPQEVVTPAENHVQQQDPSEYKSVNVVYDETQSEEHMPSFPSSIDVKQDSSPHPPSPPTLKEEPVEGAPKTYASVLRTKAKATVGTAESQQSQQLAQQVQSVPVHEKSNLDNNRTVSAPDDEEEFISCYVGNLSPSTSVFDLEKVFQAFGRIKPDGVAIRSRKEAGVFFGFVEFEDISGIQNALNASPIELNGRLVHVEERRPNCGFPSGRISCFAGRGRGRDQAGGRYDGEYTNRSKGTGHQKKGGRQYDSYY